jgi:hypothetical protein
MSAINTASVLPSVTESESIEIAPNSELKGRTLVSEKVLAKAALEGAVEGALSVDCDTVRTRAARSTSRLIMKNAISRAMGMAIDEKQEAAELHVRKIVATALAD